MAIATTPGTARRPRWPPTRPRARTRWSPCRCGDTAAVVRAGARRRWPAARRWRAVPERRAGPAGIPGSGCPGRARSARTRRALRERLREFARVQVFGEVFGLQGRAARRCTSSCATRAGALPCSMWREDFERARRLGVAGRRRAGRRRRRLRLLPRLAHVVAVVLLRGDRAARGRRGRPARPARAAAPRARRRGPVRAAEAPAAAGAAAVHRRRHAASAARRATTCSPGCAAAAGRGRLVWAFAPVQDRHAAPAITRALQDLAACEEVDVIVVARGGGSLADLFAFCDETLCRTVALLRVPVIASVGHHTDRTLIDDVAAVSCSTPTHAAEAAVPVDCAEARAALARAAAPARAPGAPRDRVERARTLARSRARPPTTSRATARGCTSSCASCARARAAACRRAPASRPRRRARPSRRRRGAAAARGAAEPRAAPARSTARPRPPRRAPAARSRPPRARARGPRPAAHARARLRAGRGRRRRAGHVRRGRARAAARSTVRLHDGRVQVTPDP